MIMGNAVFYLLKGATSFRSQHVDDFQKGYLDVLVLVVLRGR